MSARSRGLRAQPWEFPPGTVFNPCGYMLGNLYCSFLCHPMPAFPGKKVAAVCSVMWFEGEISCVLKHVSFLKLRLPVFKIYE